MPYSKVGHLVGASAIISIARSISTANAAAAVSLRAAYHSRAARASTTASGWNSILAGIRAAQDLSASLGPGDGLDLARVEFLQAPPDLSRPSGLGILVNLGLEAVEQLAGEGRSRFRRETESVVQQFFCGWAHGPMLLRSQDHVDMLNRNRKGITNTLFPTRRT